MLSPTRCPSGQGQYGFNHQYFPASEGHFGINTPPPHPFHRWIRAQRTAASSTRALSPGTGLSSTPQQTSVGAGWRPPPVRRAECRLGTADLMQTVVRIGRCADRQLRRGRVPHAAPRSARRLRVHRRVRGRIGAWDSRGPNSSRTTGVKAKPSGWPPASPDPRSGREHRPRAGCQQGMGIRQNHVSTVPGDCHRPAALRDHRVDHISREHLHQQTHRHPDPATADPRRASSNQNGAYPQTTAPHTN